jgi:hypothetical protein
MSMTALPLTVGDVQNIQIGVGTFSDANAAQLVVNGANATPATTSLFMYANGLVASAFGFANAGNYAAVAIAVDNLTLGGVPPAGPLNAAGATTPNELQNLAQGFAPPQASLALKLGLADPTIYVTEQMAQALAAVGDTNLKGSAFATNYGLPTTGTPTAAQIQAFAVSVAAQTGAQVAPIVNDANFWINFYTVNGLPSGIANLSAGVAGAAAALGDAIGAALVDNTAGNNFSQQFVFNALVDNAQVIGGVKNADGTPVVYKVGAPLNAQQVPVPLQGQAVPPPANVFNLTPGVDTFTTSLKAAIFNANPASNPPLGVTNTLNAGDNLQDTAGDGTLNFTAIASLINPPNAAGVTMNGVSSANIVNNVPNAGIVSTAGFSGNITGLAKVVASGTGAPITLGTAGQGLNTALTDVTLNSSFAPSPVGVDPTGFGFTAWMTAAALAGKADAVTVHLTGVGTPGVPTPVNLEVTAGANGYETMNVESKGAPNNLMLNTDATSTATIVETGDQNLTIAGSALNIANLKTYNGSAGTGTQNVFFNGNGGVAATGGTANDTFTFTVLPGQPTSFVGPASSVDGGGGVNKLVLEADTGAIIVAGDAGSIKNIQEVDHITVPAGGGGVGATGDFTADLAGLGSATTFNLAGDYKDAGGGANHKVLVSDITNAQTVEYSGKDLGDLTLTHQPPVALNANNTLMMNGAAGAPLTIDTLTVPAGNGLVTINSAGAAADNVITKVDAVAANVEITGGTHLTFGSKANPYDFAGGTIDATTDTGGVTTWLSAALGPAQTFVGGAGNDIVNFIGANDAIANFANGGVDTAVFHNSAPSGPITGPNIFINVDNFVAADAVDLKVADINATLPGGAGVLEHTNGSGPVVAGEAINAFQFQTGTAVDASGIAANFIDIVTPQNVAVGETAQVAYDNAFGGGSIISNNAFPASVMAAFYDVTDQQAVYVIDTQAFGVIVGTDIVRVVGLVHMTEAQFNTGLAAFTAFV